MPSGLTLGDHYEALVRDLVASGRYRNATEVVQAGLQMLEDLDADLRARRAELEASFAEALADVEAGNFLTADEVESHFKRRASGGGRFDR
ncbi:type II toxin-antitoxin system ParD family antitoxin [Methylopila henanensis]|uniref:Type II toxin-antitoxin system ParD family antitoxin n=1 Tax=Methylopila henanensis TaxID=873516 RepID=A0ABW4K699_9HYPH